jgi:hypothetical protein
MSKMIWKDSIDFLPEDWQDELDYFSEKVKDGQYIKVDYKTYRLLRESKDTVVNCTVLDNGYVDIEVLVRGKDGYADTIFFDHQDRCFGQYMWDFYFDGCGSRFLPKEKYEYYDYNTNSVKTAEKVDNINYKVTNEKENTIMKGFNFDFGPVSDSVRMSIYGLAVKNKAGSYVSYNKNSNEIVDVDILNFNGSKFLYKMPVAIKDIAVGDIVVHQNLPMFVVEICSDNKALKVVDPVNGERKDIMLARSPFGFNFATKVVNFIDGAFNATANSDNPFGNMWMLFAMGENNNMSDLMPLMFMSQNGSIDPNMAMFMMMSDRKGGNNDFLPLMFASQMMNKPCECKCHAEEK